MDYGLIIVGGCICDTGMTAPSHFSVSRTTTCDSEM